MGFLAGLSGAPAADVDHDARSLAFAVPLGRGAAHRFTVRVLAPADSGGDTLTLAVRALYGPTMTDHHDRLSVSVGTRTSASGLHLGGVTIAPAGLVVLALLAGGVVLWRVLGAVTPASRRRARPAAAAVALTLAVGFLILFASMAWRDYRSLTIWTESACTVLGGRLSAQGTTPTRRSGALATSADETTFVPELGLRYAVDGRDTYSTGFDTGSRLGRAPAGGRAGELDRWTVGAQVPCWYDPTAPRDVVVLRGFGGAYLFALFPLPLFIAGLMLARRR